MEPTHACPLREHLLELEGDVVQVSQDEQEPRALLFGHGLGLKHRVPPPRRRRRVHVRGHAVRLHRRALLLLAVLDEGGDGSQEQVPHLAHGGNHAPALFRQIIPARVGALPRGHLDAAREGRGPWRILEGLHREPLLQHRPVVLRLGEEELKP